MNCTDRQCERTYNGLRQYEKETGRMRGRQRKTELLKKPKPSKPRAANTKENFVPSSIVK